MIEGIGHWIRAHPSHFLSDQYLKYIAWALSDKVGGCRTGLLMEGACWLDKVHGCSAGVGGGGGAEGIA